MENFKLQIVTPNREFFNGEASMIVFETTEGEIGVLKGHIPLTTILTSGTAIIKTGNEEKSAVLHGGFAEISGDEVVILTDAAEWPHEIDLPRARAAKERAEKHMTSEEIREEEIRMISAKASLMRAIVRIKVAEFHNKINE